MKGADSISGLDLQYFYFNGPEAENSRVLSGSTACLGAIICYETITQGDFELGRRFVQDGEVLLDEVYQLFD